MADDFPALGVDVDLLGDPFRPLRDPRGRPSWKKTKENQLLVMSLRSAGMNHDEIAEYLGCDGKTLRKYFSRELDHGAMLLEGLAVQVLVRKMLEGHVGAAKQVRDICSTRAPSRKGKAAEKPAAPGKKEQARIDAGRPPAGVDDLVRRTEGLH